MAPRLLSRIRFAGRLTTSRWRALPDFIIIGTPRGGTTGLFDHLSRHPQVSASIEKEIQYFDSHYSEGIAWYRAKFPLRRQLRGSTSGRRLTGEASPLYLVQPQAPPRARRLLPDVRLIVLFRNPVQRAHSAWRLAISRGREHRPFEDAVEQELPLIERKLALLREGHPLGTGELAGNHFLTLSLYDEQIGRWLACYRREQFFWISSEEVWRAPRESYAALTGFLKIDDWSPGVDRPINRYAGPAIDPELGRRLARFFAAHNEALFRRIGRRYDWDDMAGA